ncbi:adhesion G-protein coupled receptor G7 [Strigops habroptila]|uniref:adhesion G-protein coupled receptor G7 n=1 Tax=Strigops habroptila TaxID=2489341 RepID=UPI0011D02C0D|nr:adhesion G-protein coupled receptor G7 [Strigops habroptila]
MSSLHWDRILVGITCCVVTITLWALCIWQLVLRFKTDTTESEVPLCFCLNGGICQDGACVCPEEWVGSLCEIVNFCEASTYTVNISESITKNLTFGRIIVSKYGNSEEKCKADTANGNTSIAIRMCSREGRTPTLEPPKILNCDENLDSLASQIESVNSSNIAAIASNTEILTSMPDQLSTQNIYAAATITVQVLKTPNVSKDAQASMAAVATVSQLLDANETEFNNDNLVNVTTSLTKAMEEFSLTSNISQTNVAVQSAPLKLSSSTILFSAQRDTTLEYYQPTTLEIQENVPGLIAAINTEVQILFNIINHSSSGNGRVGFVLYQNAKLFQSRIYQTRRSFSRQIVSGNIDGGRTSSVEIAFSPKYNISELHLRDHACVFWDYTVNDWNTAGCAKGRDQFLRCRCNHTTNFAVLMAFQIKYKYAKPLEYISYIGVGLSMAGVIITILFQIFTRKTRKSSVTWMLVSLCFSMLIFNIIFISGIENRNARNHSDSTTSHYQQYLPYDTISNTLLTSDLVDPPADSWCTAVAVLLHYFLLATFMWSALNSAQLYLLLLRAMKPLPEHFLITMSVIGWGIPAVVVAITLGATYREGRALNYRQEEFCWLAALDQNQNFSVKKPMLWSFLLPVALILLFNIITFITISVSVIWKKNKNLTRNKKDSFMKKMVGTISIEVVLGITWTIGYLMLISHEETSLFFSYLFCILNATQGLQICILYTFRSPAFKNKVSKVFLVIWVTRVSPYLHSKTYYVSKQPAKCLQETFRSTQTSSENSSLSTFPN